MRFFKLTSFITEIQTTKFVEDSTRFFQIKVKNLYIAKNNVPMETLRYAPITEVIWASITKNSFAGRRLSSPEHKKYPKQDETIRRDKFVREPIWWKIK